MLRRIAVIAASALTLACGTLPASAAASPIRTFGIPGVHGVRAWGSYQHTGTKIRVTVCVKDVARDVYGAAAAGLAFDSSYRHHDDASATAIGYGHTQCQILVTRYSGHLVVEALSGYRNGKVRRHSTPKQIY
ncbi:MAG TPA: hypothetical protein VFW50_43120 [Streptosporangiaceae bacterium]|nr:hypothetical protein [Streptosporangiaceae bacterium]